MSSGVTAVRFKHFDPTNSEVVFKLGTNIIQASPNEVRVIDKNQFVVLTSESPIRIGTPQEIPVVRTQPARNC